MPFSANHYMCCVKVIEKWNLYRNETWITKPQISFLCRTFYLLFLYFLFWIYFSWSRQKYISTEKRGLLILSLSFFLNEGRAKSGAKKVEKILSVLSEKIIFYQGLSLTKIVCYQEERLGKDNTLSILRKKLEKIGC